MATRLYLQSSGTPPLASLAKNSNWELETGLVRLPCKTTKQNTALATSQRTWPSGTTQQWCWWQFQSQQLLAAYSWTTADTVSMVIGKCAETTSGGDTHLNYCVRVVSSDGTVIRGIVGALQATAASEFPLMAAAATKIHNALTGGATNFSSQIGDRIIIEIGVHGLTPALELIQMRIGDPSAVADFALTTGLTTDLVPWVELSRTVSLGTPPITADITETATGTATESSIFTGLVAEIEAATGTETLSATFIGLSEILETGTAIDSLDAEIIPGYSVVSESVNIIESSSVIANIIAGISEISVNEEFLNSSVIYPVNISETIGTIEDLCGISLLFNTSIVEAVSEGGGGSIIKRWTGSEWVPIGSVVIYHNP